MSVEKDHIVGFVGLGNMGYFMASNLAKYLSKEGKPSLRVWNRTKSKVDDLIKEGEEGKVVEVDDLKALASQCHIILTSLANDDVVKSVYEQLFRGIGRRKETIFVEMSTVYPTVTGKNASEVFLVFKS